MGNNEGRRRWFAVAFGFVLLLGVVLGISSRAQGETPPPLAWVREFGSPQDEGAAGASADGTGVYVVGDTLGSLPGHASAGLLDAFVRKYGPDGTLEWSRQFGGPGDDGGEGIAVDASAAYVVGVTAGDAFLRKFGLDGSDGWTRVFGTAHFDSATAVAVGPTGVYVGGQTCGVLAGTVDGKCDAYVRRYSFDGAEGWTVQFGGPDTDAVRALALDGTGVYAGGSVFDSLPGQIPNGANDAFLRKYTFNGTEEWTRQFGTSADETVQSMAPASSGAYAMTLASSRGGLAVVQRFDADGTVLWTRDIPSDSVMYGLASDSSGAYAAGVSNWSAPLSSDTLVVKYATNGTELWTTTVSSPAFDAAHGVAVSAGGVYAAGESAAAFPGQPFAGGSDAFVARLGAREAAPCPQSHGFWKNHPLLWPVSSLLLGTQTYDQRELIALLRAPSHGDASLILAHQLIAAKLNAANGSDTTLINAALARADSLLASHSGKLPYDVRAATAEGHNLTAAAEVLDAYNNRDLTPNCGSCHDGDDEEGNHDGGHEHEDDGCAGDHDDGPGDSDHDGGDDDSGDGNDGCGNSEDGGREGGEQKGDENITGGGDGASTPSNTPSSEAQVPVGLVVGALVNAALYLWRRPVSRFRHR